MRSQPSQPEAAEQASSSAEKQAVGQELLSLADKAILDSQIELAKRVMERALAAARKSESDDLGKQATLLWDELEQPFTDEVKERARQRLREHDISPSAATQEKGQKFDDKKMFLGAWARPIFLSSICLSSETESGCLGAHEPNDKETTHAV